MSGSQLPSAVFLGTARAGSTWLATQLHRHPDVFVPTAKDLYFFDREFDRGLDWYRRHFARGASVPARIDISHDYFHSPSAAERMSRVLPDAQLLVCLREPVSWVESILANSIRNGQRPETFDRMVGDQLGIVAAGLYSTYVEMWLRRYTSDQLLVYCYDDLKLDPEALLTRLLRFLGVGTDIHGDATEVVNAAATPRSRIAAATVRSSASVVRRLGMPEAVGRVKRSPLTQQVFYREASEQYRIPTDTAEALREFFASDVERLDALLSLDLRSRWGY